MAKYTICTQLHKKNNEDLIMYFEENVTLFNKIKRQAFYEYKHCKMDKREFNKSKYNTFLQHKYNITKRTANSIISSAIGIYNAGVELRKYELECIENKIEKTKESISKLEEKRKVVIKDINKRKVGSIEKTRKLKKIIYFKKRKLEKLIKRRNDLKEQIMTSNIKLCLGTKELLKKDVKKFKEQRDSQIKFVGTKTESCGNQMFQLEYNRKINQFKIKLRKDFNGNKELKGEERYIEGKCYFNNHKKKIIDILENGKSPLTFMIIKKNNRYYLYCVFEINVEKNEFLTRANNGVIGIDFNKGFVTIVETDTKGNILNTDILRYRFKQGNKTENDLYSIANKVCFLALEKGKDLAIEDLNFVKKKSKTISKNNKKYNEMLHSLAYKKYTNILENVSYRNKVCLVKVNPAWTSFIAKHKYCNKKKLNIHMGAAFVIARRGQGFKDKK